MLHMLAATMLLSQDQDAEGMKHMEEAATYEPKDAALKERLV
jgi:hypothetical protein